MNINELQQGFEHFLKLQIAFLNNEPASTFKIFPNRLFQNERSIINLKILNFFNSFIKAS